jgi:hypothetical protein
MDAEEGEISSGYYVLVYADIRGRAGQSGWERA